MSRQYKKPTLCWDCANATNDDCPWVDRGEPVDGWNAKITKCGRGFQPYDSYAVSSCPRFKRDAEDGGRKKYERHFTFVPLKGESHENVSSSEHRPTDAWDRVHQPCGDSRVGSRADGKASNGGRRSRSAVGRDNLDLAFAILEAAVNDWKSLEYGAKAEALVGGEIINRKEVCEFFFSNWFVRLCEVTEYTPEQFRAFLRIPDHALEIVQHAGRMERGRHIYGH